MPRRVSTLSAVLIGLTMCCLTACQQGRPEPEPNTLLAIRVDQVSLDGNAAFWQNSPILNMETGLVDREDGPAGPTLQLQAVYDTQSIAIRAEWVDPTESIHKNAWTWDGSRFSRSGDEDRLMIHFPIQNDPDFASKGCGYVCHTPEDNPDRWYMASNSADFRYDQWHWKSTRSNPLSQADDKWLGLRANPSDTESGHYGDAQISGGEERNQDSEREGPEYMSAAGPDAKFILAGKEAPIDISVLVPGQVIPGYVLSPSTGSRGDVIASGTWQDGRWVVVLVRALNTNNEDDVTFIPPKPVPFGAAVTDNESGYNHMVVEDVLTLTWD